MKYSTRNLFASVLLLALGLTVVVQFWRHRESVSQYGQEVAGLERKLTAAEQALGTLHVSNPEQPSVLASPSYAYGRWVWRVYLPPGKIYDVNLEMGPVVEQGSSRTIAGDKGNQQHVGVRGNGETTIVVEEFTKGDQRLLGIAVGEHEVCCRIPAEVAQCLDERSAYEEQQLGTEGTVSIAPDQPIPLLMRWYPEPGQDSQAQPVGLSAWLDPQ